MGNKKSFIVWGVIIFLVLVVGVLFFKDNIPFIQQISSSNVVFVPEFGNIICTQSPEQLNRDLPEGGLVKGLNTIVCGSPSITGYYPYGCDVYIRDIGSLFSYGTIKYYGADGSYKNDLPTGANKVEKLLVHLKPNEKITVNLGGLVKNGQVFTRIVAQPYGLQSQERGFLSLTRNCNTDSLTADNYGKDYHALTDTPTQLPIGVPYNYIATLSPIADSLNLMTLNGKQIYVFSPDGRFYYIKTAKDGTKYADIHNPSSDSSIKCQPSLTNCDGGKFIQDLAGKGCRNGLGLVDNYYPINSNRQCKFTCVNDKQVNTGDCVDIPKNCPPEKPAISPITGQCYSGTENKGGCPKGYVNVPITTESCDGRLLCNLGITSPTKTTTNCTKETTVWTYLPLIILGVGIILLLLLYPKKGGKK